MNCKDAATNSSFNMAILHLNGTAELYDGDSDSFFTCDLGNVPPVVNRKIGRGNRKSTDWSPVTVRDPFDAVARWKADPGSKSTIPRPLAGSSFCSGPSVFSER